MPHATLNDLQLHYRLEGNPDPAAPVLVLSNSLGTALAMWQPQLDHWLSRFRVLRYDTRGHGDSSVTPGPYTIAQLGMDVIGLLDQLQIARAHFCGISMGGITGMWLARHHPERIGKLVLSNTAAYIGPPDNWSARAAAVEQHGVASIADAVVARWLTPAYAAQHAQQVAWLTSMLKATPDAGYAAACRAVRDSDLRGEVAAITAPTLVIAGSGDLPTPPADGQFLHRQIAASRYLEFDAAHLSNQQHPLAFAEAVSDFLLEK